MNELYAEIKKKIIDILTVNNIVNVPVYLANNILTNDQSDTYITYDITFSNKIYEKKNYILNLIIYTKETTNDKNYSKFLLDISSLFEVIKNYDDLSEVGFLNTHINTDNLSITINELQGSQSLKTDLKGEILQAYQLVYNLTVNDNRG